MPRRTLLTLILSFGLSAAIAQAIEGSAFATR